MLKALVRIAATAAFGVSALFGTGAQALVINQMFVFGDSLSDPGNAASMTPVPVPPNPPFPGGQGAFFPPSQPTGLPSPVGVPYNFQFSNGPVAMQYLANRLAIAPSTPAWPASPSNSNPNFAVGGAMTGAGPINGASPIVPDVPAPFQGLCCNFNFLVDRPHGLPTNFPDVQFTGLNNQVALFQSRLGTAIPAFNPATTLFSIWGGPNDVFLALALIEANPGLSDAQKADLLAAYTINAALNIGQRVGELALLNGQHFLVLNMPDLGATPFAATEHLELQLTGVSMLFNAVLGSTLDALRANAGLDIIEFDTFKALDDLILSKIFPNTTVPCLDTTSQATVQASIPGILAGCQGDVFFDDVHPTTAVNAVLAGQLFARIPEPGSLALLAIALVALASMRRRRRP